MKAIGYSLPFHPIPYFYSFEESAFQAAKVESVIAEGSIPHFRKGVPYLRAPGSRMRDHLIHERVMSHLRIDA